MVAFPIHAGRIETLRDDPAAHVWHHGWSVMHSDNQSDRGENGRLALTGGLLLVVGAGLLGVSFALTGDVSPGGFSLLAWVTMCGGALRLVGGIIRWRPASPTRSSESPESGAAVATVTPEALAPMEDEPASLPPREPMMTPLAYDLWLLGLGPDAIFSQVRRAYWTTRQRWERSLAVDAPERILATYNAYRRLRRIYIDSHAV